jgi:23S rRNA (cytosine1962-C5)-methyltransferase
MPAPFEARVTKRGAERWAKGHPWIYASDVDREPGAAGIVAVADPRGKVIGQALYSPTSEIRLRLLEADPTAKIDIAWWRRRFERALTHRRGIDATAYRIIHAEGDGLPSLVVDRYDRWLVVQLLSAGLETIRGEVVAALIAAFEPTGILLRNDVAVRRHEGLAEEVVVVHGTVPSDIEVREGSIRFLAAPWTGQKTGAFLDQRANRIRAGQLMVAGGRALDCFSYHGSFALHLAARAGSVVALDTSDEALDRGTQNAKLNGFTNISWRKADAFEALRELGRTRSRFDLVVIDPPAFAKSKAALPQAIRGYKDINLHAMRLVEAGGFLLSASCSFHLRWPDFLAMIADAARDCGRRVTMIDHLTQPADHPEVVTIPETGYLKSVVLRVD